MRNKMTLTEFGTWKAEHMGIGCNYRSLQPCTFDRIHAILTVLKDE
jgi:hypothetical protein